MNALTRSNSALWQRYRCALLAGLCATAWLLNSAGCRPNASSAPSHSGTADKPFAGDYPIQATVTVGMLGDLVRQIGGPHVQVTQLMGSGVDPHLYKPLRDAILAIRNADIVFYNGLLLEGKMSDLLAQHGRTHRVFAAGDHLTDEAVGGIDPHSGHPDPHVWMNVNLWSQVAEGVGKELAEFDPAHADDYARATEQLRKELAELHAYGKQIIGCIPAEQRVLVTSHDAFRYFGEAYGVEVEAVQGISTESEAGLSRVNELVDMLVARKVGAIFTESSVPQDSIRALLRGAESKGHQVRIPDTPLYSDAMGEAGTYSGTYIGMMDHNFTTIARELGCPNAAADGFRKLQTKQ